MLVLLLAVATGGWLMLRADDPTSFAQGRRVDLAHYAGRNPTGVPPARAAASVVRRGEYLARAGDCASCHTVPGGHPMEGGRAFKLPFGTLYAPNITPDRDTGIGDWSDADFLRAMREGVAKDGTHLYPAFPYPAYSLLTSEDALAIKAYLFSLKPIRHRPPPNDIAFPFNQRYLLIFWNLLFKPDGPFRANNAQSADWNRGAYLAEALGHCGDCHTPRNLLQGLRSDRKFAGTVIEGWKAYNITPDPVWGIGGWSGDAIADYLALGHAVGRSSAAGPMAEAVENSTRFLTWDDLHAMAAYVASVPPRNGGGPASVKAPPAASTIVASGEADGHIPRSGVEVYESACASCHGIDGIGTVWAHATLVGNRSVSDPDAVNASRAVLSGAHLRIDGGTIFMPAFGRAYDDTEIAAVLAYVADRFGAGGASVTPAEIAKRREE